MRKKDIWFSLLSALLVGVLSLPTLNNILSEYGFNVRFLIAVTLAALTLIGLATLRFLSRWVKILWQMAKFIVVGGLNTFLDFAVLNLLIASTGISAGGQFSLFKALSISVAIMSSYFWNKHWTFDGSRGGKTEFIEFLLVSLVGMVINVVSASFLVNYTEAFFNLDPVAWANLSSLIATFLGLAWNFLGYKLIVFRKTS